MGRSRRRATVAVVVAAVLIGGLVAPGTVARAATGRGSDTVRVGSQVLTRCSSSPVAYCGTLQVPLEWGSSESPTIPICYRWYPATSAGPAAGTVMPVEGGPGYPTIGSVGDGGYGAMYGPVLARDNLLAIDLRGTGCSDALYCHRLQDWSGDPGSVGLAAVVGRCADALDHRWRFRSGGYVHASDLFTSAESADDVAAVVRKLRAGPVDLYGDSYGSWFAQVFASRFPSLVRSVVLDSTYPVQSLDPWYRITIDTMPADFDAVCRRSVACADAGGHAWAAISALARLLRRHPLSGTVPGPNGREVRAELDAVGLVNLVSDATEDPALYAALPAAARAEVEHHDAAPLLRLDAERTDLDEAYFGLSASDYSVLLYMAVSCSDYPQLYPMDVDPATRLADLEASEATLPASTFAPFTTAEWLAMNQNTENYTACLDWPEPTVSVPPIASEPPFLPARMPVLILGGELDTWTPPAGVPEVEAELGGDDRFVEFANETHVVGEYDVYGCASSIVQAFVTDPAAIDRLDVACASSVPSIRAVGSYPSSLDQVSPVVLSAGRASVAARRMAAAAVETAGDAWCQLAATELGRDDGLHGGVFTGGRNEVTLMRDELVPGVAVSGTVAVSDDGVGEGSVVTATLTTSASGRASVHLTARWLLYGGSELATIHLSSGASSATGELPAPESAPY